MIAILIAAALAPQLPDPPVVAHLVVPSQSIELKWTASPDAGCSNRIYVWQGERLERVVECGETTWAQITVAQGTPYRFELRTVRYNIESENNPSLVIPPRMMRQVRLQTWSGNTLVSDVPLVTFQDTPPGDRGFLVLTNWQDYNP